MAGFYTIGRASGVTCAQRRKRIPNMGNGFADGGGGTSVCYGIGRANGCGGNGRANGRGGNPSWATIAATAYTIEAERFCGR